MKEHKCQGCQSCQGSNGHGCSCESKGCNSEDCSCDNCDDCKDCDNCECNTNNRITEEKLLKYKTLTSDALRIAKSSIVKGKEEQAKEIIDMVSNYISDAEHFESEKDFVNSFAALNYAHGWIDSGVRLEIFDVTDDKLFTVQ